MTETLFTVGVIGAGRIGQIHINNLKQRPDIRLKTIARNSVEGKEEWFASTGAEVLTDDYRDIIEDKEIDTVFICSPTEQHPEMIVAAARAGKNIFCEKPISQSDEETMKAYQAVKEADVPFMTAFNRRFDRNFRKVQQKIKNGEIGKIHQLKITSRDPEPPAMEFIHTSGGMFFDMSIHDFDMARFLTDSYVTEVYAKGGALISPELEGIDIDTAIVVLTFENGTMGVIDNSRKAVYGYDQRLEVFGEKGAIKVGNETETQVVTANESGIHGEKPLHFFLERYEEAFCQEVNEFIDALKKGNTPPVGFEDAIHAQRVAAAAEKSLHIGKPVKVDNEW